MESVAIEAGFYAVLLRTYMTGTINHQNSGKEAGMRGKVMDMDVLFMGSLIQ